MYAIQPKTIELIGTLTGLDMYVVNYKPNSQTALIYYMLTGDNANYSGNITVPQEVVDTWGTDDDVIVNYVAAQLGVTIIEE